MSLDIGVLTVGSLYWDDREIRNKWRNEQLNLDSEVKVKVPIRYGRKSGSRSGTYTIVFSRLCRWKSRGLGTAKAILCSRQVDEPEALISEAESLWAVERKEDPSNTSSGISSSWGCVGLLPNPYREIPDTLLEAWSDRVDKEDQYGSICHTKSEGRVVDDSGLLQIHWPATENNEPLDFDLLLATPTDPEVEGDPRSYPSIEEIASAWIENDNEVYYFCNNLANGINTYQDQDIKKRIEELKHTRNS